MTDGFAPLRLTPFEPRHEAGVVELLRACYAGYGQVLELETLDADLRAIPENYPSPENAFRVLLDGERVVGTVAVKARSATEAELKRVFLDEALRGRGLGKRLSLWAFDWAAARGHELLHIWSDVLFTTAHAMYLGLGAEATGERRRLGGANDVVERYFGKRLQAP